MSKRRTSIIAYILLISFGAIYLISINGSTSSFFTDRAIGPSYFPNLLGGLLFAFCIIGIIQSFRTKDVRIDIPHFKHILFTIVWTVIFLVGWYFIGLFYVQLTIYLAVLFAVFRYKPKINMPINIALSAALALISTSFIYIVFGHFMSIRF